MAAKRRKVVMEDLDIGTGTVTIPTDSGGTRVGTQINLGRLNTIVVDLGSINADLITGSVMRTSQNLPTITMNSAALQAFDVSGNIVFEVDTNENNVKLVGTQGIANLATAVQHIGTTNAGLNMFSSATVATRSGVVCNDGIAGQTVDLITTNHIRFSITSTGDMFSFGGSYRVPSNQGIGTTTDSWAFVLNTSLEGFVAGIQRITVDTTSSPTASPLWLYYNGTLTNVKVFDDGMGHKVLYF